jgi:hypothetical protein
MEERKKDVSGGISIKVVGNKAYAYIFNNPFMIACYYKNGNTYYYKGCVELFEDAGHWLEGGYDINFIEDKPVVLPEKVNLGY